MSLFVWRKSHEVRLSWKLFLITLIIWIHIVNQNLDYFHKHCLYSPIRFIIYVNYVWFQIRTWIYVLINCSKLTLISNLQTMFRSIDLEFPFCLFLENIKFCGRAVHRSSHEQYENTIRYEWCTFDSMSTRYFYLNFGHSQFSSQIPNLDINIYTTSNITNLF